MHLDGDLNAVLAGERVDLGPERHRDVVPLIVQRVEVAGVPGVDVPRGPLSTRMSLRQA